MKHEKPVAFNYVKAMERMEGLEEENRRLREENQRLRVNLEIKGRIEWADQKTGGMR